MLCYLLFCMLLTCFLFIQMFPAQLVMPGWPQSWQRKPYSLGVLGKQPRRRWASYPRSRSTESQSNNTSNPLASLLVNRSRDPRPSAPSDQAPTLVEKQDKSPLVELYAFEDVLLVAHLKWVALMTEDYDHNAKQRWLLIGNCSSAHTTRQVAIILVIYSTLLVCTKILFLQV